MIVPTDLTYIDDYGLLGSNFYWHKYEAYGMTKEDILRAGLTGDRVQVSAKIIDTLIAIDREMQKRGWRLYIKEGYRSEALYRTVYEKRVIKFGKEATDATLNVNTMPHASGLTVDVSLLDVKTNLEIPMRKREDGIVAFITHFYASKDDPESKQYQELQDYVAETMMKHGFRFGRLKNIGILTTSRNYPRITDSFFLYTFYF